MMFTLGLVLFSSVVMLPQFLQTLNGGIRRSQRGWCYRRRA